MTLMFLAVVGGSHHRIVAAPLNVAFSRVFFLVVSVIIVVSRSSVICYARAS